MTVNRYNPSNPLTVPVFKTLFPPNFPSFPMELML